MHTEIHCTALTALDRTRAIRAIHRAWLQLAALDTHVESQPYDNKPALDALAAWLREAGHPGFAA